MQHSRENDVNISLNQNRSIDFDVRPLLSLNYQMQYDLNGGRPFAAEALLRISGDTENAAPSEILARAEANGSIKQITLSITPSRSVIFIVTSCSITL